MTSPKLLAVTGGGAPPAYIEDVFSTYLYTGNSSTQTITNGIDLSGKGGLVWIKSRSAAENHFLFDTARGANAELNSNTTDASTTLANSLTAFNSNGFSISSAATAVNTNAATYASWTFRKQAKFFDVVTYTGNGSNRTIAHNLGSVPGCIIVKRTDTAADWQVYHRSLANTQYLVLNTNAAKATGTTRWNSTTPTSTEFSLGTDTTVNANGGTYVAYLFAHDAGGFGLAGTDNVISCGSFTTDAGGSSALVNLGWEPQWLLVKRTIGAGSWEIYDTMRGFTSSSSNTDNALRPNSPNDELYSSNAIVNALGFSVANQQLNETFIYIAIRRGPMKVPTSGTSVFTPVTRTGTGVNATTTSGFPVDMGMTARRFSSAASGIAKFSVVDRIRGARYLITAQNAVEATSTAVYQSNPFDSQTGIKIGTNSDITNSTASSDNGYLDYMFKRAPGFFDVVAYTGTGSATTVNHNLAAVPEMMIVKRRASDDWWVYDAATGNTKYQVLNSTAAPVTSSTAWNNTTPTSTVFTVGTGTPVNASGGTYIAYLFATVTGVSKVGSYTGNGTSQTINCGFTTGARFILIKRTNAAGDWCVFDTARGINPADEPRLRFNTLDNEGVQYDSIDTDSSGFIVNQIVSDNLNLNGATYIFLAIA